MIGVAGFEEASLLWVGRVPHLRHDANRQLCGPPTRGGHGVGRYRGDDDHAFHVPCACLYNYAAVWVGVLVRAGRQIQRQLTAARLSIATSALLCACAWQLPERAVTYYY